MNKNNISRNLGYFTGPLMIVLGVIALNGERMPKSFAMVFIGLGIVRLGLTIYVSMKNNKASCLDKKYVL